MTEKQLTQRVIDILTELSGLLPEGVEPWITFNKFSDGTYEVLEIFDLDSKTNFDELLLEIDEALQK